MLIINQALRIVGNFFANSCTAFSSLLHTDSVTFQQPQLAGGGTCGSSMCLACVLHCDHSYPQAERFLCVLRCSSVSHGPHWQNSPHQVFSQCCKETIKFSCRKSHAPLAWMFSSYSGFFCVMFLLGGGADRVMQSLCAIWFICQKCEPGLLASQNN